MEISIGSIKVAENRRAVDYAKVREIAESMSQVGLINAISVRHVGGDVVLVAGKHRLEAAKSLGWDKIEATVLELDDLGSELAEIDENLMRNELHYIDRGNAIKRRDELLTEMGVRAKRGRPDKCEMISHLTTPEIAAQIGVTARTVQQEKQIATSVLPCVQEVIKATDIPKVDAIKIARLKPDEQKRVAEKLGAGAQSYSDAMKEIRRETIAEKSQEQRDSALPSTITLIHKDVFDGLNEVNDESVDLLNTDPPYMIVGETWDTFKSVEQFKEFTESWLKIAFRKLKKSGRAYISFSHEYQFILYEILERNNFFGFNFGQILIWNYRNNNKPSDRKMYRHAYEPVFYLYGPDAGPLNFTDDTYGETQLNVWTIATPQSNFTEGKDHPTQKPLDLYRRIIKTGCKENDVVLDCFAGSGTTGVVCKELGRKCILIERDDTYVGIIKGRVNGVV